MVLGMRGMLLRSQAPIATAPLVSGELALPEPRPGELRVRVRACATCRTDLHVIEGGRLALYGFGSSAHITLQVARHRECVVYVVTRDQAHQRLALELGAEWAGGAGSRLPVKVDAAIVFAPAGELVPVALRDVDKGGTVALAGIYMSDVPAMAYEPHL